MKKSERASYLQLFKDCGWEHITDFNKFSYFRKAYSEIESDAEFEIYNDVTGKLDMVHRILRLRLLPVLFFLSMLIPLFLKLLSERDVFSGLVFLLTIMDCVLFFALAIQISYIFWRLFQKWKELSDS